MNARLFCGCSVFLTACPSSLDSGETDLVFQVEAAPRNGLVQRVTWETPEPSTSIVEFGRDGVWERRVSDPGLSTQHEVLVVGMVADATYDLRVSSYSDDGWSVVTQPVQVQTPPLPHDWITASLDIHDPSRTQPGWTLCNVATAVETLAIAVLYDEQARPIWYYDFGDELGVADIEVTLTSRGNILIGPGVPDGASMIEVSLFDEILWEAPRSTDAGELYHHVFHEVEPGEYVTTFQHWDSSVKGTADTLRLFDHDLQTTWEWSFWDYFDFSPLDVQIRGEITHVNSIEVYPERGTVCVHAKYIGLALEIDRATGEIQWIFGEDGDFSADPYADEPFFEDAHGLKCLGEDRVLLYDNGSPGRGWSRLVEYQLDREAMSSEIVWQYPEQREQDPFFSFGWGDADRLDNGNTLCTYGEQSPNLGDSDLSLTRIFEVEPGGERVWQMSWGQTLPSPSAFKAERIPALSEPLTFDAQLRSSTGFP